MQQKNVSKHQNKTKTGSVTQNAGLLRSVFAVLVLLLVLQYTTYRPRERGSALCYPFVFTDIMGLDPTLGLLLEDVDAALRGRVRDGYEVRWSPDPSTCSPSPTSTQCV